MAQQPRTFQPMSIVAKRSPISATVELLPPYLVILLSLAQLRNRNSITENWNSDWLKHGTLCCQQHVDAAIDRCAMACVCVVSLAGLTRRLPAVRDRWLSTTSLSPLTLLNSLSVRPSVSLCPSTNTREAAVRCVNVTQSKRHNKLPADIFLSRPRSDLGSFHVLPACTSSQLIRGSLIWSKFLLAPKALELMSWNSVVIHAWKNDRPGQQVFKYLFRLFLVMSSNAGIPGVLITLSVHETSKLLRSVHDVLHIQLSVTHRVHTRRDERTAIVDKKLIRRWDSERELFCDDIVTHCAPEATEFGEITQNKDHYAVQSHSMSPI